VAADPFVVATAAPGEPTLVLIAQANRWRAKYNLPLFPMVPGKVTREVARYVISILAARYGKEVVQSLDFSQLNELAALQNAYDSDPVGYANANVVALGLALSRYGDALGLPKAIYGYGAQKVPTWMIVLGAGAGLLAIGSIAGMISKRRRSKRLLPAA